MADNYNIMEQINEELSIEQSSVSSDPATPTDTPDMGSEPTSDPVPVEVDVSDDVMRGIEEAKDEDGYLSAIGKGLINGGIKAGESMSALLAGAMNLPIKSFESTRNLISGEKQEEGFRFNAPEPTVLEGDTTTQNITTALTQFGLQFYTGGNITKSANLFQGGTKSANFLNSMAKGAYADFTAFRGDEQRLSDLLVEIDNPIVNNAWTQYLANDPNDSDVEGRFKNMIEGAGLGVLSDIIFAAGKGINLGRKAMLNGEKKLAGEYMKKARESIAETLEKAPTLEIPLPKTVNKAENIVNEAISPEEIVKVSDTIRGLPDAPVEQQLRLMSDTLASGVRIDKLETEDGVKSVMNALSEVKVPEFKSWDHGTQVRIAQTYGMDLKELQKYYQLGAVNEQVLLSSEVLLKKQAEQVTKLISEGVSNENIIPEVAKYQELLTMFSSFKNISGRTLDANRIKLETNSGNLEAAQDFLRENFGNDKSFDKFKEAWTASGGDPREVSALLKVSLSQKISESALELWKNSILSGIRTFNVNLIGTLANSQLQIPIRAFEGAAGVINVTKSSQESKVYIGEAAAMAVADVMSFMDLLHSSARLIKNPQGFTDNFKIPHALRDKAETGFVRKISTDYWGMNTPEGAISRFVQKATNGKISSETAAKNLHPLNIAGATVNVPVNLINIQDGFVQNHAMRKQKFALAYRKLRADNTPINQWGDKFYELMSDPEFNKQITPDVQQFAKRVAFQEEMGTFGKTIDNLARTKLTPLKIPVFEYLIPFRRTPAGIMKQGIAEPLAAPITTEFWDKLSGKYGGVAKDEALGRLMFGTSVASTAASFTIGGQITGSGPNEPKMRRAWLDAGNKPYSIRVQKGTDPNGNPIYKSYEYGRIEPLSFIIGSIASAIETHHYTSLLNDKSEKTFNQYVGAAINALNEATLDKSFFTGPQDFFLFMADPERYGPQWMNRFGTSFVPNLSRDIEMMLQDKVYLRDFREFENAMNQKIIGNSTKVPVTRNRWGDPIAKDKGWFLGYRSHFSPIGMDDGYAEDIDREINRLAVEGTAGKIFPEAMVAMPPRAIIKGGVRIRLDAEQYSRLVEIAGKEVKLDNLGTGTPMTLRDSLNYLVTQSDIYKQSASYPATQARLIKELSKGYDEYARELLIQEYPELQDKVKDAEFLNIKSNFGVLDRQNRNKLLELMGEELE